MWTPPFGLSAGSWRLQQVLGDSLEGPPLTSTPQVCHAVDSFYVGLFIEVYLMWIVWTLSSEARALSAPLGSVWAYAMAS